MPCAQSTFVIFFSLSLSCRWVCPFSRQYTVTALCFAPFLPWNLKIKFVHVSLF